MNIALGTAPNNTVTIDKETISIGGQDFYAEKAEVTLLINKGANNDLIDQGQGLSALSDQRQGGCGSPQGLHPRRCL